MSIVPRATDDRTDSYVCVACTKIYLFPAIESLVLYQTHFPIPSVQRFSDLQDSTTFPPAYRDSFTLS